ncbi:hypothetical protein [Oryzifoliimicrobium ureilyticus]|uniref:hypothetical protein n=1 Tax=Oryzifoliimicrobium ureilyticus TaxID=3113724 RepID=UPI0030762DF1
MLALWVATTLVAGPDRLPFDVTAFLDRRAQCQHWSGEEPYDAERAKQIEVALQKLHCDRLDADEAWLRRQHARNMGVIKALDADP